MTPGEWAGLVAAVAAAAAVLGGAIAAYIKLQASIGALGTKWAVLSTKLDHVLDNDLPHIREKLDALCERIRAIE